MLTLWLVKLRITLYMSYTFFYVRKLPAVIARLIVCQVGRSASDEFKECPPPSTAVLWFVNGCERKSKQKKKKTIVWTSIFLT